MGSTWVAYYWQGLNLSSESLRARDLESIYEVDIVLFRSHAWLIIIAAPVLVAVCSPGAKAQPLLGPEHNSRTPLIKIGLYPTADNVQRHERRALAEIARRFATPSPVRRGRLALQQTSRRGWWRIPMRAERRAIDIRDPFVVLLPPLIPDAGPRLTISERLLDALAPLWSQLVPGSFFFLVLLGWRRLFRTDDEMLVRTRAGYQAFYLYFFITGMVVLAQLASSMIFHRLLHLLSLFVLVLAVIQTLTVLAVDGFLARSRMVRVPVIVRDVTMLILFLVVSIIVLSNFGVDLTGVLTGSVVLTAVIGLAFQDTLGSIASGLALQVERPFQENDWIQFGDEIGRVLEINWRSTKLLNLRNEMVVIPNKQVTGTRLRNLTAPILTNRCEMTIRLAYGQPPNRCKQVLEAAARTEGVCSEPPPFAVLSSFEDWGIQYTLFFFITSQALRVRIEDRVRTNVWYRLRRAGIAIPFPSRDITVRQAPEQDDEATRERQSYEALTAIASIPFLEPLGEDDRSSLAAQVEIRDYGAGETVIHQGDVGDSLFFIQRGEVEVLANEPGLPQPRRVAMLGAGEFFGEMSLMTGERRTATIRTLKDAAFFVIGQAAFREVLAAHPDITAQVADILQERQNRLAGTERLLDNPREHAATQLAEDSLLDRIRGFLGV